MSDGPSSWEEYLSLQSKLLRKSKVDDHSWGLEAGLNRLLAAIEVRTSVDVDRTVASRARRERNRLRLLHIHGDRTATHDPAPEAALDAKRALEGIQKQVDAEQWRLICAVAEGHEYAELADSFEAAAGTLRARVLRLRRRLDAGAALLRAS